MSEIEIFDHVQFIMAVIFISLVVLWAFDGFDFSWDSIKEDALLSFIAMGATWFAVFVFSLISVLVY